MSRFLLVGVLVTTCLAQTPAAGVDDARLRAAQSRGEEWITHGRDYAETRYSPLRAIHAGNVRRLGLAWSFDMETKRGLEATPIIVDGVLYVTGAWSVVYALDARSGKLRWKWDPAVPRSYGQRACCDVVNRGVAVYRGKVYVGTLDGRLAALEASSGRPLWEVVTVDQSRHYTITGAPRVVKGKVIIGNGGAEFGVRGYVSAYDAESGKLVWRFYTVPGDPALPFESPALEKAAKTWTGRWWEFGGGGTVWDSLAFDPELDLLFVGTGNGSPWMRDLRSPGGGDNLYLSSILALKPDTGELVWHYQTTPGDSWDYTATQHMILADLTLGGRQRKVIMQAPKNGFFYVLDRATGELLSAKPFAPINWATGVDLKSGRPIEAPGVREQSVERPVMIQPGPMGAHNWQPMAFHPGAGLVYIPARMDAFPFMKNPGFPKTAGVFNEGQVPLPTKDPTPPDSGELLAWDPVAQRARWRVGLKGGWNGGVLATAGDLVFQGTGDGRLVAYSADRGAKLWEVWTGAGIIASPVTYSGGGRQYISVLAGWGGAHSLFGGNSSGKFGSPGRLLTFSLDGKTTMPALTSESRAIPKPLPFPADTKLIETGSALYATYCVMCHGVGGASGGSIADLRYSSEAVFGSYPRIVLEGSMQDQGMPAFQGRLTPEMLEAIRVFLLDRRAGLSSPK